LSRSGSLLTTRETLAGGKVLHVTCRAKRKGSERVSWHTERGRSNQELRTNGSDAVPSVVRERVHLCSCFSVRPRRCFRLSVRACAWIGWSSWSGPCFCSQEIDNFSVNVVWELHVTRTTLALGDTLLVFFSPGVSKVKEEEEDCQVCTCRGQKFQRLSNH
jgi:hypothetical protein